jgi:hypothetical protein
VFLYPSHLVKRTGLRWWEWLLAALLVVGAVSGLLWWLRESAHYTTDHADRRFAIETVIVAIAALVAALLAAIFAWPVFRDYLAQQKRPVVTINTVAFDMNEARIEPVSEIPCTTYAPPETTMHLQVVLHVEGTTVRDAVMNIQVHKDLSLTVTDQAPAHGHYLVPLPSEDSDIDARNPDETVPVRYSRVERNFPPGNFHVYAVVIGISQVGTLPVRIVLDGTPNVHAVRHLLIRRDV